MFKRSFKFNLNNKIILFTGGYGHLGKEAVALLAKHNATVYVLGRSKEKFDQKFDEGSKQKIKFQKFDLKDKGWFVLKKALKPFKKIRIAVYLNLGKLPSLHLGSLNSIR